jgi:hypothetical protein
MASSAILITSGAVNNGGVTNSGTLSSAYNNLDVNAFPSSTPGASLNDASGATSTLAQTYSPATSSFGGLLTDLSNYVTGNQTANLARAQSQVNTQNQLALQAAKSKTTISLATIGAIGLLGVALVVMLTKKK